MLLLLHILILNCTRHYFTQSWFTWLELHFYPFCCSQVTFCTWDHFPFTWGILFPMEQVWRFCFVWVACEEHFGWIQNFEVGCSFLPALEGSDLPGEVGFWSHCSPFEVMTLTLSPFLNLLASRTFLSGCIFSSFMVMCLVLVSLYLSWSGFIVFLDSVAWRFLLFFFF